jgi:hypothetical protein
MQRKVVPISSQKSAQYKEGLILSAKYCSRKSVYSPTAMQKEIVGFTYRSQPKERALTSYNAEINCSVSWPSQPEWRALTCIAKKIAISII